MSGREKVGRPKGLPKTGGRKRGTPNRSTLSLREKLAALDYDSAVELVNIARDPKPPRAWPWRSIVLSQGHEQGHCASLNADVDTTDLGGILRNAAAQYSQVHTE